MSKVRVPVVGSIGKSVAIEADAPSRGEMNAAIAAAVANIPTTSSGGSSSTPNASSTLWRLIREIPTNIANLASLATAGFIERRTDGSMTTVSSGINDVVLRRTGGAYDFGALTLAMANDRLWTYDKLQAVTAASRILGRKTAGAGGIEECTLSDILDFIGSAAQGDILYRGASGWARLGAGSAGYVLSTNGTGANPTWIAPAAGGSGNTTPDTHPSVANAADDEFETGSSIDTTGSRFSGATPWAWRNQGTATANLANGSLVLNAPASGTDNQRIVEQVIPAGAWKYRCKLTAPSAASYYIAGMVLLVNSSGKLIYFCTTNNGGLKVAVAGFTNVTTYGGYLPFSTDTSTYTGTNAAPKYLELEYDGATTWTFRISVSGVTGSFIQIYSANVNTAFLGAVPDRIGLIADSRTTNTAACYDWFRRVA